MGTADGLNLLKDGKIEKFQGELPSKVIGAMTGDRNGRVWVGTLGGALSRIDGKEVTTYDPKESLTDNMVWVLHEDRYGTVWMGTSGGLKKFSNGRFTRYTEKEGLSSNTVLSILEAEEGRLWIGTHGGGINLFEKGKFFPVTSRKGLLSDVVYSILKDREGRLWMSSDRGVFSVKISDLEEAAYGKRARVKPVSYGTMDGMSTRQCTGGVQPSAVKGHDGTFYYPTVKGFSAMKLSLPKVPGIFMEKVVADCRILDPWKRFSLRAEDKRISFHYTSPALSPDDRREFSHKLEGFDNSWVDAGKRRKFSTPV